MSRRLPSTERVLPTATAAHLVGATPRAIRTLAEHGLLRFDLTPGGHRRFAASEVLEQRRTARALDSARLARHRRSTLAAAIDARKAVA